VCPTGIDIRNGIQLECVNCTACIDACDTVMEKIDKPKGLIRYGSVKTVQEKLPFKFTNRAKAYSLILLALIGLEAYLLWSRSPVETTLLRVPGQLYQETGKGTLTNLYQVQMVNKTHEDKWVTLILDEPKGILRTIDGKTKFLIPSAGRAEVVFFIEIPEKDIKTRKTPIQVSIKENEMLLETHKSNFVGPI
jgi:polyferredoxin